MNAAISHEKFTLGSKEAENYRQLKNKFRIKYSKRGDTEKDRLIRHEKRIEIDEIT